MPFIFASLFQSVQVLTHPLQYGQADLGAVAALGGKHFIGGWSGAGFLFSQSTKRSTTVPVHVRVGELLGEIGHARPEGVEEQGVVEAVEVGGGEGVDLGLEML
ncbi:FAD-linked oxidase, putative [Babesia ovata]|uniref:FAD-linked oxidase, putative n=1 Tax=Babesia ovata TaxID=189622 RepID=A0A2H6KKA6_9APIC|nr:FAD-linked oxidase, putative [Babesia ovata]GBE63426.1 FAD-linked oxidase, putative [Babesia ovata]